MASESNYYYVPESSKLPIFTALGMGLCAYGAGSWVQGHSPMVFLIGAVILAAVLWAWFGAVIRENLAGLYNERVERSFVWGMSWFIFSEVMFFAVFFGALFYVRTIALPELGSPLETELLWKGFEPSWPLHVTPEMAVAGEAAKFKGPREIIDPWHIPLINTIILLSSSVTVHFAHTALKNANRRMFIGWLAVTVLLGAIFLGFQIYEYGEAYRHLGLTLNAGIYGTTFFMLTGFHGAHVTIGTFMLLVQLVRAIKGHFSADNCFGFEASSWYWHFVDVVWVGLFIFVYVLGS
ncbi:MAG: cytochrome c oxidase subunit III [Porticoccaceae bacterium]|nr:MAG: cytochrome c oxidase subunit III [Porticoccaceae bacterium]